MFSKLKKIILTVILIIFVSVGLFVAAPRPAQAVIPVTDYTQKAWNVVKDVLQRVKVSLVQAGITALLNAAQSFTQKLAYDAAVYIASGGSGQKPLFDGKSFGDYIRDTALDGAMSFITNFSDSTLGKYGFNVCAPSLSLIGKIKIGLLGQIEMPPKPRCDFKQFTQAWDQFGSSVGNGTILKNFGVMFEPGNSELEFALEFNSKLIADTQNKLSQAIAERTSSGGWQNVKNFINGRVTTPSDVVSAFNKEMAISSPQRQQDLVMSYAKDALRDGAYALLPTALSTFTNSLINQSMKRLFEGLFKDTPSGDNVANSGDANSPVGPAIGRRLAEQVYSDLIKPRIISSTNYDPLLEFTACPSAEEEKQINNCVLDDGFAAAVRQADQGRPLTIAEALDKGYLDGNKPLISGNDARNEQMDCYQQGYCYSNLVKLRKARILPVGFELAAEIATGNVSAMKGSGGSANNLRTVVSAFNDCNEAGARDASHPYCHLIDPNWVLRLPKTQCKAMVYGPTLASTAGGLRAQTCVDPVSCLSQDENGNCVGGWGYCTKERNIWRISADTCQEQFNTCLTYKARDNKQFNYLQNTTDFGSCSSENVGCRAYAVNQKENFWSFTPGDAVYLNKDAEQCDVKNAGCAELYSKANGLAYNLLPNPSFEKSPGVPGWSGGVALSTDGTNSFDGQNALNPAGANLLMASPSVIKLSPNTAYAFSGYVKSSNPAGVTAYRLAMFLYTDPAAPTASQFNPANIISTCKIGADLAIESVGEAASAYNRVSCAFFVPGLTLYARPLVGGNSWVDAVQLEEGSDATPFLPSGYGAVDSVFVKVAPDYLDCQAGGTDSRCAEYAPACKVEEVGCERYTPKNGSPAVSGSVSINDICFKSCDGYETYRQEKTIYETEKFPLYLIPSTARTCNSADAGCDEFTNLATEAKEYFSYIRQCVKLDPKNWDAFYTWEGSGQTGYQLRAHKLKVGVPQAGNPAVPGSSEEGPVPAVSDNNYAACTQAIFKAPIADPAYNPDCREFYNAAGKVSYRLLSKTIIATDECVDYRKTDSNSADCAGSGGDWNSAAQTCIYHGYKTESRVCAPAANKCRAYAGASASNLRIVSQDDFEGHTGGWKGKDGAVSSEALSAGGHSYKTGAGAGMSKDLTGQVFAAQSYSISFWAKGNGGEVMQVAMSDARHGTAEPPAASFSVTLKGDWQYYELGPINTNQTISSAPMLQIKLSSGKGFYIDNIVLKEASQKLYLIKNSWVTPAECDRTLQNVLLPQAMLGCKEYTTRANESIYLKSFSALCRDEAVGCAPFQNTYNSAKDYNEYYNLICSLPNVLGGDCKYNSKTVCSIGVGTSACRFNINDGMMTDAAYQTLPVYKQSDSKDYNAFQVKLRALSSAIGTVFRDESTVETASDKAIYIVDDKKYYCQEKDMGCSVLGQTELYKNAGAATVYFKNTPDDYSKILCTAEAEGCESWTSNKGVDYFKVPKGGCEYKNASGGNIGGWYKKGTDTPCYPGFMKNGVYGIWRNADTNFNGSAGLCPETQNGCTEFVDPLDTSAANAKGRPYYLIDNDKLKALQNDATCSGKASLTEGCVLLDKTSDIDKKWHSFASYFAADQQKKLVRPVDKLSFCGFWPEIFGISVDPFKPCAADIECPANLTQVFPGIIAPVYTGKCEKISMDSNTILKVTRDRECGEWLTCRTSYMATNPITQKSMPVCAEVGLCDKAQATGNDSSLCANFIANNPDTGKVLSADNYSKRQIGWGSKEYSGFSIGNQVPVTDAVFYSINSVTSMFGKRGDNQTSYDLKLNKVPNYLVGEVSTCRGYPEEDSPFPSTVAQYYIQGFKNVNSCESGENCECDYTKLTYGNKDTIKYVNYGNRSVPAGICQGGSSREGQSCRPGATFEEDAKNSCGPPEEGGTCLKLQRQDDVIGLSGYCLERDQSTPINGDTNQEACLTWLPQDIAPGQRDIYNQFRTAGYVPPLGGGKYYCLQATGNYSPVSTNQTSKYANLLVTNSAYGIDNPFPPFPTKIFLTPMECGQGWYWNKSIVETGSTPSTCDVTCKEETRNACAPADVDPVRDVNAGKTLFISNIVRFDINHTDSGEHGGGQMRIFFDPQVAVGTKNSASPGHQDLVTAPVYKDEIDLIEIKVAEDPYPSSVFSPGAVFYIRSNQRMTDYGAFGGICNSTSKTDNCSGESAGKNFLTGQRKAKSLIIDNTWYFRYDSASGDEGQNRDFTDIDLFNQPDLDNFCQSKNTGEYKQYAYALRFHFNNVTGKLENLSVASCSSVGKHIDNNKVALGIYIHKREVCETIVDLAAFKNRAQTNVLWADNPDNKKEIPPHDFPYHFNYEIQPFGSAASNVAPDKDVWYSYSTVGTPNFAGIPWTCKGTCGTPFKSDDDKYTIDFNPNGPNGPAVSNQTLGTAINYMSKLFSWVYNVFTLNRTTAKYDKKVCANNECGDYLPASEMSKMDLTMYPQVYSYNSATPKILGTEGRVSINDSTANIQILGNQYLAKIRFYAWADTNHMPLRSIKVDWGDGSAIETTDGSYKNHKPLCAKTNSEEASVCSSNVNIICDAAIPCPIYKVAEWTGTGYIITKKSQTCTAKAITFGNSPGACEEAYFEFQHTYICSGPAGTICKHTPKVWVTDNWDIKNNFEYQYGPGKQELFGPATGPEISLTEQ